MKWLFIFIVGLSIGAASPAEAQDEGNSEDFDYVVKVLGIGQNHEAIERLRLSWETLLSLLAEMREPIREYEDLVYSAYHGGLRSCGSDASVGLTFGLRIGLGIHLGLGTCTNGFRSRVQLKTRLRVFGGKDSGLAGAAGTIDSRKFLSDDPLGNGYEGDETTKIGGGLLVVGVGLGAFGTETQVAYDESLIGLGLLLAAGENFHHIDWDISLPFHFLSHDGRRAKKLNRLLQKFIREIHSFDFASARETSKEFRYLLGNWKLQIKNRIFVESPQKAPLETHPLMSIRNLFEPSFYERSLGKRKEVCRTRLIGSVTKPPLLLEQK